MHKVGSSHDGVDLIFSDIVDIIALVKNIVNFIIL